MIASTQTNHPLAGTQLPAVASKGEKPIDIVCARLKSAGMRITQPRIAILSALLARNQPIGLVQVREAYARAERPLLVPDQTIAGYLASLLAKARQGKITNAHALMIADMERALFTQAIELA